MQALPQNPDEGSEPTTLIRALSGVDHATRESAARELFRRGLELALNATSPWFADAELARWFVIRDEDKMPIATVGIAVERTMFSRIRTANGSPPLADVPPDQDAEEFEVEFPGDVRLDILTTRHTGSDGAIARYLQKFGMGIQQIEFLARDIDRATEILRRRFGQESIYPATRLGANGTRVNFFLVPTQEGKKTLIELVELPRTR